MNRYWRDAQAMLNAGMIRTGQLWQMFTQIEPQLISFPAIDPTSFRTAVRQFCDENQ